MPVEARAKGVSGLVVTVEGKSLDQLPQNLMPGSPGKIPTQIARPDNTIIFTLYGAPGLTVGVKQQSRFFVAGKDSVVLVLDSLRIGFRMPSDLFHQLDSISRAR